MSPVVAEGENIHKNILYIILNGPNCAECAKCTSILVCASAFGLY